MYLVGAAHPHKADALAALERLVSRNERLVTSSEVCQEIPHPNRPMDRPDAMQPAFGALLGLVDEVYPVDQQDVEKARDVLLGRWALSARGALLVAVMQRHQVSEVPAFDVAFESVPGFTRLH